MAQITGARLRLGSLPPLGGDLEPVGRLVTRLDDVTEGDVFWAMPRANGEAAPAAEIAFARGAQGVVGVTTRVEPWAGRFVLEIEDSEAALCELAAWCRRQFTGTVIAVITDNAGRPADWIDTVLRSHYGRLQRIQAWQDFHQVLASVCNWHTLSGLVLAELDTSLDEQLSLAVRLCRPRITWIPAPGDSIKREPAKWERHKTILSSAAATIPPDGWLVTDGEQPDVESVTCRQRCRLLRVGRDPSCDVAATDVQWDEREKSFCVGGTRYSVPGSQAVDFPGALAALAVGRLAGLDVAEIRRGLTKIAGSPSPQPETRRRAA